jgi:TRAP-type transport system periplasmic protein
MSKKISLLIFILVIVLVLIFGSSTLMAQKNKPEIVLRYSDVQAPVDSETMAAEKFAEIVYEKSNGLIEIQVYPSGQLGNMQQNIEALQMGAIEIARTNPGWIADVGVKSMNLLVLPYLFTSLDHANEVLEGEVGKILLESVNEMDIGLKALGYYQPSSRHMFFAKDVIKNELAKVSDVKGLKIRVPTNDLAIDMIEAIGASPTPIAYAELYSALQTGIVDGAENPLKGYYNIGFYEVAPYFVRSMHQFEPSVVLFSERHWNNLSPENQVLIQESFNEACEYYKEINKQELIEIEEKLKEEGIKFYDLENIEEWQEKMKPLHEKYGEGMQDLVEMIR